MIDQICTPVINGGWAVTRWAGNPLFTTTGFRFRLLAGDVNVATPIATVHKSKLIEELTMQAFCQHGVAFGETDDVTIAWHFITHAIGEIALATMRTGGTTLAVTQEMHEFLSPHKPASIGVHWVIDESAPTDSVLITYHGIASTDGGYPCEEHSDGNVTLFQVDPLDPQYYRLVLVAIPTNDQNVYLNWSR